jgi:hypothetical protein
MSGTAGIIPEADKSRAAKRAGRTRPATAGTPTTFRIYPRLVRAPSSCRTLSLKTGPSLGSSSAEVKKSSGFRAFLNRYRPLHSPDGPDGLDVSQSGVRPGSDPRMPHRPGWLLGDTPGGTAGHNGSWSLEPFSRPAAHGGWAGPKRFSRPVPTVPRLSATSPTRSVPAASRMS